MSTSKGYLYPPTQCAADAECARTAGSSLSRELCALLRLTKVLSVQIFNAFDKIRITLHHTPIFSPLNCYSSWSQGQTMNRGQGFKPRQGPSSVVGDTSFPCLIRAAIAQLFSLGVSSSVLLYWCSAPSSPLRLHPPELRQAPDIRKGRSLP